MPEILLDYEASRQRFLASYEKIRATWKDARLLSVELPNDEQIDIIEANAPEADSAIWLTGGLHGVEGPVGDAVIQDFCEQFLPRVDASRTNLRIVHALNAWGYRNLRRVNANNVDLNRNFWTKSVPPVAPEKQTYHMVDGWLNPQRAPAHVLDAYLQYFLGLVRIIFKRGAGRATRSILLGQYGYPHGIYYGGTEIQPQTRAMMGLYQRWMGETPRVIHIDMHTGYGPARKMAVINSTFEMRPTEEFESRFNYPLVWQNGGKDFYPIEGDMIDYLYRMRQEKFPLVKLYSATFEFGTLGNSLWQQIQDLRAIAWENQAHWQGGGDSFRKAARADFLHLFAPQDERAQNAIFHDARRAFEGILKAEGLI
jgi:hypothetical protein